MTRAQDALTDRFLRWMPKGSGTTNKKFSDTLASHFDDEDLRIDELYDARWIDFAAGAELDQLGTIVDLGRLVDELDANYRARIKAFVGQVRSRATLEDVVAFVANTVGVQPEDIIVNENADFASGLFRPAYYTVEVPTNTLILQGITTQAQITSYLTTLQDLLVQVDAAGVKGIIVVSASVFYEGNAADLGPTGQGTAANGYWANDPSGDFGSNSPGGIWGANSE